MRLAPALLAAALLLALPAPAGAAEWLAGDGHVHTCYSHDAWCPGEEPSAETLYSNFGSVEQRFDEAALKGLDFLVVSDHNDVRAWSDPAFGSHGVLGVHAYEASLDSGHAHAIGVTRLHEDGGGVQAFADSVAADGGLLQANHPSEGVDSPLSSCEEVAASASMSWRYGFSVQPSLVEVWNPTSPLAVSELYWECWLQRGAHMPAGAGSDSHGALTAQIGNPTLWVLAAERSEAAIVAAMRLGRTTITRWAPSQGAMRLVLTGPRTPEGPAATVGDTVPRGSPLTARAWNLRAPGYITVRANGRTIVDRKPILPGGAVRFTAPDEPGWVRATLHMSPTSLDGVDPNCTPNPLSAQSPLSLCDNDLVTTALTSPIHLR
jgi:hypothetical protein